MWHYTPKQKLHNTINLTDELICTDEECIKYVILKVLHETENTMYLPNTELEKKYRKEYNVGYMHLYMI